MSVEIRVPEMGESVVEATVGAWRKQLGDSVVAGDVLLELETEKVNLEITAENDGVVESIHAAEGAEVGVGELLATLGPLPAGARVGAPEPAPITSNSEELAGHSVSPAARRIAEEHEIDVEAVEGTGRRGLVTKEDVLRHVEQHAPPSREPSLPVESPAPPTARASTVFDGAQVQRRNGNDVERIPMSRRRQTIARRLVEAQQTAAMLTTFNEIDMSACMELRSRHKDEFRERFGVGLGYMSFFVKAVIGALKSFPNLNAEIQGTEFVIKHYYNVGVAIGVEAGLVVPVLRDADKMSFAAIEQSIVDLAEKARENTLALDDLIGGNFTITNGGIFGSLLSTPILNTPEVGILGMHKIQDRPVAIDGQVVIRPMMYVALSYDHRIVDGREAVQFLVKVKELVEEPAALLLEA